MPTTELILTRRMRTTVADDLVGTITSAGPAKNYATDGSPNVLVLRTVT